MPTIRSRQKPCAICGGTFRQERIEGRVVEQCDQCGDRPNSREQYAAWLHGPEKLTGKVSVFSLGR